MKILGAMIRGSCALGVYAFAFYGAFVIGPGYVIVLIVMLILGTDQDIWGRPKRW